MRGASSRSSRQRQPPPGTSTRNTVPRFVFVQYERAFYYKLFTGRDEAAVHSTGRLNNSARALLQASAQKEPGLPAHQSVHPPSKNMDVAGGLGLTAENKRFCHEIPSTRNNAAVTPRKACFANAAKMGRTSGCKFYCQTPSNSSGLSSPEAGAGRRQALAGTRATRVTSKVDIKT